MGVWLWGGGRLLLGRWRVCGDAAEDVGFSRLIARYQPRMREGEKDHGKNVAIWGGRK